MLDLMEALGRAVVDPPAKRDRDPEVAAEAVLVDEIGCWERAKARAAGLLDITHRPHLRHRPRDHQA
jgi:hypothetical protein